MCEFVSWVEKDGVVFFLTGEQIYNTLRGKELCEWSQNIEEDKSGHGAIRWYYNFLEGGENKECTNFSSPTNFPPEIAKAIKAGAMRGIGVAPSLLTQAAFADYLSIEKPAKANYLRIKKAAKTDYDRIVKATTYSDYLRIKKPAKADYLSVEKAAYTDYDRIEKAAKTDYDRIMQDAFWDLFSLPEHRAEGWK